MYLILKLFFYMKMFVFCVKIYKWVNFGINNNFVKGVCRISIGFNMDRFDSFLLKVFLYKVW